MPIKDTIAKLDDLQCELLDKNPYKSLSPESYQLIKKYQKKYQLLCRAAIAGEELVEAAEKMNGEMTADGMPTLYSLGVMRAERDAALATYRKAVEE